MNKEERKRLINANYGLNYNKKLKNRYIDYKHLEKFNLPKEAIYTDADSIIINSSTSKQKRGNHGKILFIKSN